MSLRVPTLPHYFSPHPQTSEGGRSQGVDYNSPLLQTQGVAEENAPPRHGVGVGVGGGGVGGGGGAEDS